MKKFIQFNEKIFSICDKNFIFRDRKIDFVIKNVILENVPEKMYFHENFPLFYDRIDEHRVKKIYDIRKKN